MWRALRDVAGQLGVTASDARLLRLTNNAVFAVPSQDVVVRVTRSHGFQDRVRKVVRLAAWFAEVDAATIRLAPGIEQPVRTGELLATVWRYLPARQPAPDVADLGHVLRAFHHLGAPEFRLPPWDPVADARARLADAEGLSGHDHAFLLDWCQRLAPNVATLNRRCATSIVHGDAHAGNLLREPEGRIVLCDFDPTCRGPWQVDLVAVAVGERRFQRPGAHARLAAAYGYDVTTDPDWPLLREARELKMVTAAVPLLASSSRVAREFQTRLRSIVRDDRDARWTPFADLRP